MRKYEINYKQFCGERGHKLPNFPDLTSVGANSIITHTFPSQQTLASSCQVPHSSLLVSITLFLPPSIRRAAFVTSSLTLPFT